MSFKFVPTTRLLQIAAILTVAILSTHGIVSASPPNIVIVMVDDMGFSDIGCYGGEIPTPHLDQLANSGLRFSQFYNTGRCCPTRASLLTGLYPAQCGMGDMTRNDGLPGYRGELNDRCVVSTAIGNSTIWQMTERRQRTSLRVIPRKSCKCKEHGGGGLKKLRCSLDPRDFAARGNSRHAPIQS